jgi:hypothetical protein
VLGSIVGLAACGPNDVTFTTRFASDFNVADRHAVSVFGVFRDGQMSSEAWGSIASRVSPALGAAQCDAAYTEPRVSSDAALWSAVEDYARDNGPTDELLTEVAPAARGDLILVITVAGRVPAHPTGSAGGSASTATQAPAIGGRGGMGGGGRGGGGGMPGNRAPHEALSSRVSTDALDLSASLFSVSARRSVGLVAMEYSGSSADEAIAELAAKLAQTLHGASCTGWSWDTKLDVGHIRQMREP